MEHWYHLQYMEPVKQQVILPSINLPIDIPVNPLLGCIYSLLEDQNHILGRNLIFPNMNDPSKVSQFSEVNTGLATHCFHKHVKHLCNAVPIPCFLLTKQQLIAQVDIHKLL